jgi:hypothetical protein
MWIDLTPDLLLSRVTAAEKEAVAAALAVSAPDALADIAAMVAADWRSGLRRIVAPDRGSLRIPDELLIHILADFRYRALASLPGMSALLDDLRVQEWRRAMDVRDGLAKWTIAAPAEGEAEGTEDGTPGRPTPLIYDPDGQSVLG